MLCYEYTPIQDKAADLIKIAMIHINDIFNCWSFRISYGASVIYGELIFEISKNEIDKMRVLIDDKMNHTITLGVTY